ncbi:MAG TPA: response regulator transcription factor, partial [Wenzhouxiangella sp.]
VVLVDDQTLIRQGVRSLLALSDDIEVVGEASDGQEALEIVPKLKPDVLLLDLRMPNMNGLQVLEALAERDQQPPTLILTTFDDDELVLGGIRAGAKGYLLKDVALEDLLNAVRTLASGNTLVNPAITDRLLKGLKSHTTEFSALEQPEAMTGRETEILRLMAGGYSNKEIARALDVAEGTIKNHVSNILSKMGVRDRTRAVLKAIEAGLI